MGQVPTGFSSFSPLTTREVFGVAGVAELSAFFLRLDTGVGGVVEEAPESSS